MFRVIGTALFVSCIAIAPAAQPPTGPSFEVASIKPVKAEVPLQRPLACGFGPGGRFRGFGSTLWFIACAYGIPQARSHEEISGGPKWLDEDFFDIEATAPPENIPRSNAEALAMLRTLLAERFKLEVHRQSKEMPMYALVVARRDGRLGPRLQATPAACAAWIAAGRRGGPPPIAGDLPCGRQILSAFAFRSTAMSLSQLANLLTPRVERPVQDRTGLGGTYALDLQWRPEDAPNAGTSESLPTSLFTALQEQLGLKLEPTKGTVDLLVVDRIERPSPN